MEDQRHQTVATLQSGRAESWKQSCGIHLIALYGTTWCEVQHGRLTPDGIAKREAAFKHLYLGNGFATLLLSAHHSVNLHVSSSDMLKHNLSASPSQNLGVIFDNN